MGKFKAITKKTSHIVSDPYDVIDSLLKKAKDPFDSVNRMYWTAKTRLQFYELEKHDTGVSTYYDGNDPLLAKAAENRKNIRVDEAKWFNGRNQILAEVAATRDKRNDLKYGTHNYEIHRLEVEKEATVAELKKLQNPDNEKPRKGMRISILQNKLKNLKNNILRLKALDEPLMKKIEEDEKHEFNPYEDPEGMVDPFELLHDTEPSPRNRDLYSWRH